MPILSPDQFTFGMWAGIALLWLALSIVYRRSMGKPLVAHARPGSRFMEGWASVRVGTGLMSRLGSARNCMQVQVTADVLHIHPHFPFTVGFMPELYDLDKVIPLSSIRSATILGGSRAKAVEVRYLTARKEEGVVHLLLRNAEAFIHAVLTRPADT